MADTGSGKSSGEAKLIPLGSHSGAAPIPLKRPVLVIGSRKDIVRLHLESSSVSKAHCVIVLNDWGCYIHDLGSRTHTWVNKQQVADANLKDGDLIQIGRFHFKYEAASKIVGKPTPAPGLELDVSTLTDPLEMTKRVFQIGRRTGSDLEFDDNEVSNIHAIIFERNRQRYIRDLGSRTGTWLDGKPVHQEQLTNGSVVKIGRALITLSEVAAEVAKSPVAIPLPPAPVPPAISYPPQIDKPVEVDLDALPLELEDEIAPAAAVESEAVSEAEPEIELDLSVDPSENAIPLDEDAIAEELAKSDEVPIPLDLDLELSDEQSATVEPSPTEAPATEQSATDTFAGEIELLAETKVEEISEPVAEVATPSTDDESIEIADDTEDVLLTMRRGWRGAARPDHENDAIQFESPAVDEPPAEEEPPVDESVVDDLTVEPPAEEQPVADSPVVAPLVSDEPPAAEIVDEVEVIADETIQSDAPLELADESAEIADEIVAESAEPVASVVEESIAPKPELLPLADVTDDDGAIDLSDAPAAPVAEALAEPELPLEADAAGLTDQPVSIDLSDAPIADVQQSPAGAADEIAVSENEIPVSEIDIAAADEPQADEPQAAEIAELPLLTPVAEPEEIAEATLEPPTDDDAISVLELIDEKRTESDAPSSTIAPNEAEIEKPAVAEAEVEESLADSDSIEATVEDSDEPQPVADLSSVDFSGLDLNDEEETDDHESDSADTAFAVTEIDPFDLEENETAEPLMNLADATPGMISTDTDKSDDDDSVEVVEETTPNLKSAMPVVLDDAGIDEIELIDELGIAGEVDLDLPESDSGDPIDTASDTAAVIAETEPTDAVDVTTDDDIDDYLKDLLAPSKPGDLRDLMPQDGPMLGGAFTQQPQGFMVGGSSLIDASADADVSDEQDNSDDDFTAEDRQTFPDQPKTDDSSDKRKPLRVGFNAAAAPSARSPFAGSKDQRTIADALIGRRGNSSVDVFANPSPTPEDLLLDEKEREEANGKPTANGSHASGSAEQDELRETFERFRPRGAISAVSNFPQIHVPPVYKPTEDPVYIAKVRKSRLRRVLVCTLLLLPLIGGVVLGTFKYVPVNSKLVAAITYEGLSEASIERAREIKSIQNDVLKDERTRGTAMAELGPEWDSKKGFLSDTLQLNETIIKIPSERWPAAYPNQMHLIVMSRDKENDMMRLRALAQAVIKSSDAQVRRAAQLREDARSAANEIESLKNELTKINQKLELNRALGESRPDDVKMAAVEARRKAAEQEVKSAIARRLDIEAAIEQLQKQAPTELAPSPVAAVADADADLKKLNGQLAELQKTSDAARAQVAQKNDAARAALDEVIKQFEGELKSAQKLKDNPELRDYLESASRIFMQTRQLTDDLIRRQEQQHTRLSELKQRLSDRIDANNKGSLEKDAELTKMKDELAMLTRQQNAATAEGMKEDASRLSMQMRLLTIKIEEAVFKHQNDPVQQEMIASLQGLIDQTAKSIQEDRKHIDEALIKAQSDFEKNAPAVNKLPAEQKELAESIEKRMAAVAEARKSYSSTADAAEVQQAKIEAEMKKQMAGLQAEINARKQIIDASAREQQAITAEQNRKKKLEEKQIELAASHTAEKEKQDALAVVTSEMEGMEKHRRDLLETERATGDLTYDKSEKENQIRHLSVLLRSKEGELAGIVAPVQKPDVQAYDQEDRRPLYASVGAGAIFLLMLIPIVYNLRLLSRDSHHHAAPLPVSAVESTNGFDPIFPDEAIDVTDVEPQDDSEAPPVTVASR